MTRDEVSAFFDRYRTAFDTLDGDAVADLWHVPSGIADARDGVGRIAWWSEDAPMRANMRALCEVYRAAGYARATFELRSVTPLGAQHAQADLAWTLHRADGSLLQAFRTGYHLMRTAQGLRVLMATAYEEDLAALREG